MMWLDSVLLTLTLAVALIGSTTQATDTVVGKIVVSALLVISTGLSLWVKRLEAKRSDEVQRGIKRLTTASLPTDEFLSSVQQIITEVGVAEGCQPIYTSQVIRYERELFLCRWFWENKEKGIDSLVGALVLNDRDLGELALLEKRQLRDAIRNSIAGKWGKDDLQADAELITSRVFTTVEGWLEYNDDQLGTFQTSYSRDARGTIETLSLELLDDDGKKIGAPVFEFSSEDLTAIFNLRILERGAQIARKTDEWRQEVIQYIDEVQENENSKTEA